MSDVIGSNNSYKPIANTAWVRAQLCKLQKGCTRLAAAGTPASSTTKTGRHDIAEILLKVALNIKIQIPNILKYPIKIYLILDINF